MGKYFDSLVDKGNPAGEVIGVERFIVEASGLDGISLGAHVLFENGAMGMVKSIDDQGAVINVFSSEDVDIGTQVVMLSETLVIHPSNELLGRIVDPLLRPLDGGGPILSADSMPVFAPAPTFSERELLSQQLETGVSIVDALFPIVMGQRIAIMGDPKSGKSSFVTQIAINQARQGKVIVLVLIAKRATDLDLMLERLRSHDVLKNMVVVVADSFAPLPLSYLAPYSGCTIAEYFWKTNDVVILYDDLTSHAKIYREMSLLGRTSPGRESYPGDMFYTHSSLLERAGRLKSNKKTLTSLPVVTTVNNDITSYLSTNLISITDGQIVFDVEEMQRGISPPVNTGLSVSRVGGRAQTKAQKDMAHEIFKAFSAYRQASEFAHFGQELPDQYKADMHLGDRLHAIFNQSPDDFYNLVEQQVLLKAAFMAEDEELDIAAIKQSVHNAVSKANASQTHDMIAAGLVALHREEP